MAILSFLVLPQLGVLQGLMHTFGQLGVNYLNGELLYTLGTVQGKMSVTIHADHLAVRY